MANDNKWTPIHFCASNGSSECFSYLFEKRSEIYCKTKDMENVLHLSAGKGHFNICKLVLKNFVKDYGEKNNKNQHALYGKSYRSEIFYKYSTIFLHAMNAEGNTYLHVATDGNHLKVCEILLKYDIEIITLSNKKDETAKDIAVRTRYKDVLSVLKAQYDRAGMFIFFIDT